MGAIADAFAAYARPLIDESDGSPEEVEKAFTIAQLCFNLAVSPEPTRQKMIEAMRSEFPLDDEEFADFQREVIDPMIARHKEMFPLMHSRLSRPGGIFSEAEFFASPDRTPPAEPAPKHAVRDRYAPCPCNSGKKYKFCCGKTGR